MHGRSGMLSPWTLASLQRRDGERRVFTDQADIWRGGRAGAELGPTSTFHPHLGSKPEHHYVEGHKTPETKQYNRQELAFLRPDVTARPLLRSPNRPLMPPTAGRPGAAAAAASRGKAIRKERTR